LMKDAEPNSDDRNRLEYEVSKTYETARFGPQNDAVLNAHPGKLWECIDWTGMSPDEKAVAMAKIGEAAARKQALERATVWFTESNRIKPNADAKLAEALRELVSNHSDEGQRLLLEALKIDPNHITTLETLAEVKQQNADLAGARSLFE